MRASLRLTPHAAALVPASCRKIHGPCRAHSASLFAGHLLVELPAEIWALIVAINEKERAVSATSIQSHFRGYKVPIGPLRWVVRCRRIVKQPRRFGSARSWRWAAFGGQWP